MGVSVDDYATDFKAGASILQGIETSRSRCTCGIFLFGENDPLEGDTAGGAAPRDNVVFEAGYFMSAKGAEGCLIVRQGSAKMPADLGGSIYVVSARKAYQHPRRLNNSFFRAGDDNCRDASCAGRW
jgi:predicted nucleotide-binding protein